MSTIIMRILIFAFFAVAYGRQSIERTKRQSLSTNLICQGGATPYIINGQAQVCVPGIVGACSGTYECATAFNLQNQRTSQSVCCPSLKSRSGNVVQTCNSDYSPYYVNGRPLACTSNTDCLTPYKCMQSTSNRDNICCRYNLGIAPPSVEIEPVQPSPSVPQTAPTTATKCPSGNPLMNNGQVQTCANLGNTCGSIEYDCQLDVNTGVQICCGSGRTEAGSGSTSRQATSSQCPSGSSPLITSGVPRFCSLTNTYCPFTGYQCKQSTTAGIYLCCSGPTQGSIGSIGTTTSCPNGGTLYYINAPCSVTLVNTCPVGYTCLRINTGQYRCCTSSIGGVSSLTGVCTNGGTLYPSAVQCILGTTVNCPSNYICSSLTSGQTACCSISNIVTGQFCTNGGTIHTTYRSCSSYCPIGYVCTTLRDGLGNINSRGCCTGADLLTGFCPNSGSVYPGLSTCSLGVTGTCPSGYGCATLLGGTGQRRCCSGLSSSLCSNGGVVSASSVTCTTTSNNCPNGYVCSLTTTGPYRCCTSGTINGVTPVCPDSGKLQYTGSSPKYCTTSTDCGTGSNCQTATNLVTPLVCCLASPGFFVNVNNGSSFSFGLSRG